MTKKVLFLSDFTPTGSGYLNISAPLCAGMSDMGYEVKAIGMGYKGEPHDYNFSVIPCLDFKDAHGMIHNLKQLWNFDVFVVALDITHQIFFIDALRQENIKHIGITPLENPPLRKSWMMGLSQLNWTFFISEIATQAAQDAGLKNSSYIQIGLNTELWRLPTKEERENVRRNMNLDNKFVILTVADNQERKNPIYGYDIVSMVKKSGVPIKHIHVTRENNPQGMSIRDYAEEVGISNDLMVIERGIGVKELISLYWAADVFLLPTKAEGLGMPILESMACGTPVVATDTGAVTELLRDGRGFLISSEYNFIDVWGNSGRSMINREDAAKVIKYNMDNDSMIAAARKYVESRTLDIPVKQLMNKIEEICDDKKSTQQ